MKIPNQLIGFDVRRSDDRPIGPERPVTDEPFRPSGPGARLWLTFDKSEEDALHIGIAAVQGVNYLLTWNFRHINNAEMKSAIIEIVESCGYICPQLCSPEELGGISDD